MLGRTNVMNPKTALEEIAIKPGKAQIVKTADAGKGFSKVTVQGDADLIPSNIRKDVELFGVTGTMEAGKKVTVKEGTYTPASFTSQFAIEHGLGKTPTYCGFSKIHAEGGSGDYRSEADLTITADAVKIYAKAEQESSTPYYIPMVHFGSRSETKWFAILVE